MKHFDSSIQNATSEQHLQLLRDRMHKELRPSLFQDVTVWNTVVNAAHDKLIARSVVLAEQQIREEQGVAAPAAYAFVAVGSAGRMEQTLWSDQDNGIIYADPPEGSEAETAKYFALLAEKAYALLLAAGYPPCPGDVLSTNEAWRKPLSAWSAMLREWLDDPKWESVRYMLMIADLRCIAGNKRLASDLQADYMRLLADRPEMLNHMLSNTLHHKIGIGLLGNLITERYGDDAGTFDVKYGAYIPLVNSIRLVALASGIAESSTLSRLAKLGGSGQFGETRISHWREAFLTALELRSLTSHEKEGALYTSRGMIDPRQMSKLSRNRLKSCLRTGIELQQTVRRTVEKRLTSGLPRTWK
ncbi:MAG: putative nucleotidyltransferase [Paenibacillus sp.]|nr:putative nucleotidyltransferase [Paenibacillus sp.]